MALSPLPAALQDLAPELLRSVDRGVRTALPAEEACTVVASFEMSDLGTAAITHGNAAAGTATRVDAHVDARCPSGTGGEGSGHSVAIAGTSEFGSDTVERRRALEEASREAVAHAFDAVTRRLAEGEDGQAE